MPQHPTPTAPPPLATLEVVLERITYASEETGYTVARVSARGSGTDLLTIVGNLLGAQPGESLRLQGRWKSHPQYGKQFEVANYTTVLPATLQGIRRYLGSGLIKGIGPKMAERIVAHFALDTLRVIEEEPERLIEVPGLGPKRTAKISAAWEEQKAIKEVMVFLQGVGVSTSLAVRIYKTYQDSSISVVKNEPYRLASDVWGIGFKTADKIAQSLGVPQDSPERMKAGLQYTLSEASDEGHCYLPQETLIADAAQILSVDSALIQPALEALITDGGVMRERLTTQSVHEPEENASVEAVYLLPFYRAEVSLANGLLRLLGAPSDRLASFQTVNWESALGWLSEKTGATLAPEQVEAVQLALTRQVAILTGGPGCGKSFTVRSIVALARAKKAKIILAAPTGRAAKRLEELAGMEASTLHRLLQLRPGGDAAFDREHPLDADLVVVDEASMLDVLLANTLVKAIAPGAHLLLVGDVDQLPSVGAGEVLRDALESDAIPSVRLTHIFRQAQQSGVITNAHRINAGQAPHTKDLSDFFLFAEEDAERVAELTVELVAHRIPKRFGLDARREIQVLCPMHRGAAGAGVLNERLQEALTPAREGLPERRYGGRVYRVGDKVTQMRNNYDKQVFNGSVGVVTAISLEEQQVRVRMDEGEEILYAFDELDELTHAYAISIHRSQGSEYPCVVIPLTTTAWQMLQRNLLYTAVTRAKRLVVLVGSRRALWKAVQTVGAGRRYTALAQRLQR
ncbi:MAG TPA: ATP-dependent RecD-like DNA helicase [Ktedonobacterales bacterium]|jgi:exodeoxyribonuclease V alpha subunit|nr:ATP-dependent RecD-like DNA helicase [Ktedonobacterales bacterium]